MTGTIYGMKAYSIDLRERVMAACENAPTKVVAERFGVSRSWVRRLNQQKRERGDILPRVGGGSRGRKIDRERLGALVEEQPDATLVELRDRLGVKVSLWSISKALRALKLTYKKSRSTPPSRIARMSHKTGRSGG
jgi:transposase